MTPKGMSLHIGINSVDPDHYSGQVRTLKACEKDAKDMQAIAVSQNFEPKLLLTKDATREAVIAHIRDAAQQLSEGDIFFISYAGHGGWIQSWDPDELRDETWCLYDGQLIDDELKILWSEFSEGVRILVTSDSCHSGTVIREGPVAGIAKLLSIGRADKYRAIPDKVAEATYNDNRGFYDNILEGIRQEKQKLESVRASVRLLAACQDHQVAGEGRNNGLFTGFLIKVWNDGQFQGNYDAFYQAIKDKLPRRQEPNHFFIGKHDKVFDDQKPFTI